MIDITAERQSRKFLAVPRSITGERSFEGIGTLSRNGVWPDGASWVRNWRSARGERSERALAIPNGSGNADLFTTAIRAGTKLMPVRNLVSIPYLGPHILDQICPTNPSVPRKADDAFREGT